MCKHSLKEGVTLVEKRKLLMNLIDRIVYKDKLLKLINQNNIKLIYVREGYSLSQLIEEISI